MEYATAACAEPSSGAAHIDDLRTTAHPATGLLTKELRLPISQVAEASQWPPSPAAVDSGFPFPEVQQLKLLAKQFYEQQQRTVQRLRQQMEQDLEQQLALEWLKVEVQASVLKQQHAQCLRQLEQQYDQASRPHSSLFAHVASALVSHNPNASGQVSKATSEQSELMLNNANILQPWHPMYDREGVAQMRVLYISMVSASADEAELRQVFAPFTEIEEFCVVHDDSGTTEGAYLKCPTRELALHVIKQVNGVVKMEGVKLTLAVLIVQPEHLPQTKRVTMEASKAQASPASEGQFLDVQQIQLYFENLQAAQDQELQQLRQELEERVNQQLAHELEQLQRGYQRYAKQLKRQHAQRLKQFDEQCAQLLDPAAGLDTPMAAAAAATVTSGRSPAYAPVGKTISTQVKTDRGTGVYQEFDRAESDATHAGDVGDDVMAGTFDFKVKLTPSQVAPSTVNVNIPAVLVDTQLSTSMLPPPTWRVRASTSPTATSEAPAPNDAKAVKNQLGRARRGIWKKQKRDTDEAAADTDETEDDEGQVKVSKRRRLE